MFVLQKNNGITHCECGAEICCNGSGDMPDRCPRCGEVLDFTFADADKNDVLSLLRLVEEGASLKVIETTKDGKYRLNVLEGKERVWKEFSLYQAAKAILEEENGVSLLQTHIRETKMLRWKAYEIYRLKWMLDHGFGIGDLFASIAEFADGEDCDDIISAKHAAADLFERWEQESGYNCSLWVCYNEFIGTEYQDIFAMLKMLPRKMHSEYLSDFAHLTGYKPASLFVTTRAGVPHTERCFVIPGPIPKLFRYVMTEPKVPSMVLWRSAKVRQDDGEEYQLEGAGKNWEIAPF